MNGQPPPYLGSGLGAPGQREMRPAGEATDYKLVLKQWAGVIVLFTLSFLLIVANVLIIGPLVGYGAGIVVFLLLLIYGYALVYEQAQPIPALATIVGLALLGFWILAGYGITDRFWWDARCQWEPRNKLVFVTFSIPFIVITSLPVYRFAQEIIDPNWSPTISIRPAEWGVMWPWFRPPPEGEPETREVIREVPRPFAVKGNGAANIAQDLDESRVKNDKTIIAPTSGNEVSVKDLVDFITYAPQSGATFRVWKKRRWKHARWKDVVDVWSIYGVVDQNGERSTTHMIITDKREALRRLSSAFD